MCMYFEVERDDSLYLAFIVVIFMVWSNYHHACHVLLFLLPILHFTCVQILVKLIGFTTVEQKVSVRCAPPLAYSSVGCQRTECRRTNRLGFHQAQHTDKHSIRMYEETVIP